MPSPPGTVFYSRSQFATHLPAKYFYAPTHFWAAELTGDRWRFGFTQFATRSLGEIVDFSFDMAIGAVVQPGEVVGWVEGFKGVSDLHCLSRGRFLGGNPDLNRDPEAINRSPYQDGWLYELEGKLEDGWLSIQQYISHLNATIDNLLAQANRARQNPQDHGYEV